MKLSTYVAKYDLGEHVAYYHSLRMKPVFLTQHESRVLTNALQNNNVPDLSLDVLESLKQYKILVEADDGLIDYIRNRVPKPYTSLAYFVLTEQCNLACKYCFLGNSKVNAPKITNHPMSKETANKGLLFFSKQTQQNPSEFDDKKEIIFYGGEPLLNFTTLKYIVERSKYYQENGMLSKKLSFSIVTNGLCLTEEITAFLIENKINVSISIDGASALANECRIDKKGNCIYDRLVCILKQAKQQGLTFGLSITLTEETLKDMSGLLKLINELGVTAICFNILLKTEGVSVADDYYTKATDFIIAFYEQTKSLGIYEDRFMRKLSSFVNSKIYFSDCAATSGSQIVITPEGSVGICHGCMENRDYILGSVFDSDLIVEKNNEVIAWSRLSPVFKEECQSCPALGICGGGCPINARKMATDDSINAIDRAFCIHAKMTLEYLIKELLRLLLL